MLLELPSTFRGPDQDDAGEEIEFACNWIKASTLFSGETIASPVVANFLAETRWFHDRKEAQTLSIWYGTGCGFVGWRLVGAGHSISITRQFN